MTSPGPDGRSASSRAGSDGRSASSRAGSDGRSASSRAGSDGRSASSRAEGRLELADSYPTIDPVLLHAMSWAAEFGVRAVGPGTGAALRLLAAATRAHAVVEIGTGTGVSGLWLLQGMPADSVLTSVDIEPEHHALARQSFAAAGFGPGRYRLIVATARTMLPRLADDAYDLMFVDGAALDYAFCVEQARRILRPDGLLVVNNAFGDLDLGDV